MATGIGFKFLQSENTEMTSAGIKCRKEMWNRT